MILENQIMEAIKIAMKEKNTIALDALRSVKSQIILLKTSGTKTEVSSEDEIVLLQRLVKQRFESADMFKNSGRIELAEIELAQAKVIQEFLPKQLTDSEVEQEIKEIIKELGITDIKEIGKVIGFASKKLAGKTQGKLIADIVKKLFS